MTNLEKTIREQKIRIHHMVKDGVCSQSVIYGIMKHERTILDIPTRTALKICNYLKCELIDLVDKDDPNYNAADVYCKRN
jgi:DNA-binding Xre family transcriptional regulator